MNRDGLVTTEVSSSFVGMIHPFCSIIVLLIIEELSNELRVLLLPVAFMKSICISD